MGDIVKLRADHPDDVLEAAKGELQDVLIIGYDIEGNLYAACSPYFVDGGAVLWAIEQFKKNLLNGDYDAEA